MRGRITVYCVAESIDRKALELRLRERGGSFLLHQYPDVLYGLFESSKVNVAGERGNQKGSAKRQQRGAGTMQEKEEQEAACRLLQPLAHRCRWPPRLSVRTHCTAPVVLPARLQDGEYIKGEVFYFDYGCLAFWGLTERQEREVMRSLVGPCLIDALPAGEVEVDEFQVGGRAPALPALPALHVLPALSVHVPHVPGPPARLLCC
jgi:uncharacterized Rmd1/YagE family protein